MIWRINTLHVVLTDAYTQRITSIFPYTEPQFVILIHLPLFFVYFPGIDLICKIAPVESYKN